MKLKIKENIIYKNIKGEGLVLKSGDIVDFKDDKKEYEAFVKNVKKGLWEIYEEPVTPSSNLKVIADLDAEKVKLEQDKHLFEVNKAKFEEEKQSLEAKKVKFEQEKQAFEVNKAKFEEEKQQQQQVELSKQKNK